MGIQDGRRPGGRDADRRAWQGDCSAEYLQLILKWRDDWRAQKGAAQLSPRRQVASDELPATQNEDDGKRRAKFAQGIARLEFGRSYWDERRHRALKPTKVVHVPARKNGSQARGRKPTDDD